MPRLLALAAAVGILALGGPQLAGGSGGSPSLATFAGAWQGHDRFLTLSHAGAGSETVLESCCQRAVTLHFKITHVWGTAERPYASAAVTYAHIYDPTAFSKHYAAPKVGQVGVLRIVQGVLYEPLGGGNTYCNGKTVATSKCGA